MTPAYLPPLANHLWQSTLCAAAAWLLTLTLRNNRASVRYWLWLVASAKFLVPFSLLVGAGSQLGWRAAPAVAQPRFSFVIEEISRPFAVSAPVPRLAPATPAPHLIPGILFAVWLCGFLVVVLSRVRWWRFIKEALRNAAPLHLNLPIRVMASRARLEPGVFGICKPILLLPEGLTERLTIPQLEAIVAHELCHVRRSDNLTATIHMLVEAIFWFHPLVWWIETRLVAERERACDEEVLRVTGEPAIYAQGILNVCKFYLESPLVCVSGITGADLKQRIDEIMTPRAAHKLDWTRQFLLIAVGTAALAGPLAIGLMNASPSVAQAQPAQSQPSAPLDFDAASVKPNKSGDTLRSPSMILPGGRFTATNNTLRALILNAYGIFASPYLLVGGPAWIDSERYDVDAKAEASAIPASASNKVLWEKTRLMLRTLLAERFQLSIRRETKEMPVYELVVAKNGPKLRRSDQDCDASATPCHGFSGNPTRLSGSAVDMSDLALMLSTYSDRPVLDKTGVQGNFDIKLQWNPFAARTQPAEDVQRSPQAEAREGRNPDLDSLPALFNALEQQLGLRFESRKGPVETYVIDHVERPSEN
jgi:bla regulator protein blaR1